MIWLAEQGHRVVGVELSQIAVAAFFRENGLTGC
jgi:thiopurine S-methyltransferase